MANDEHFKILSKGGKYWNIWRQNNPEIEPDLSYIVQVKELIDSEKKEITYFKFHIYCPTIMAQKDKYRWFLDPELDLQGIDFSNTLLAESCFIKSNLSRANLQNAKLIGTKFIKSNLNESNLCGATSGEADLCVSTFISANMEKVIFRWADIESTNFSNAFLKDSVFQSSKGYLANFNGAYMENANFFLAVLSGSQFRETNLKYANFKETILKGTDFSKAILTAADFTSADLSDSDLSNTDLRAADLKLSKLVGTNFSNSDLSHSTIYGVSTWDLNLIETKQEDLVITPEDEPEITVDNIEVAQFIYLILNNTKIRDLIDTISSKSVLILGRFTKEREAALDFMKQKLREHNYLPILFDFDGPKNRDLTETISTLAHMAKFVIAVDFQIK